MKLNTIKLASLVAVALASTIACAQWNVIDQRNTSQPGVQMPPPPPPPPGYHPVPQRPMPPPPQYYPPQPLPPSNIRRVPTPVQPQPKHQPPQPYQNVQPTPPKGRDAFGPAHFDQPVGNRSGDNRDGRYRDGGYQEGSYQKVKYPKHTIVIGEYSAGGDAKEVPVNRAISTCYLELVSGTVSINTVVIRPEKRELPQRARLVPGQLYTIDLGGKRNVSGFRISDNGRGVYRVIVK